LVAVDQVIEVVVFQLAELGAAGLALVFSRARRRLLASLY